MAMRMSPQVASQPVIPEVNRTRLVLFAGIALILLNLFWVNGTGLINAVFRKGGVTAGAPYSFTGITDAGLQLLGLIGLTIVAQYGGENAGTAALMFLGALWLLWLVGHFGSQPAKSVAPTGESGNGSSSSSSSSGMPGPQPSGPR